MGTNYYMFTKKKELKPFFGSKLELVDEPDFGYEINWRTGQHHDQPGPADYGEFTSVDGYRFTSSQFC